VIQQGPVSNGERDKACSDHDKGGPCKWMLSQLLGTTTNHNAKLGLTELPYSDDARIPQNALVAVPANESDVSMIVDGLVKDGPLI
jgi:hypothetical protein